MLSTVQPDRKLMVDTLAMFRASRAGLMMTPPPMPQMAPPTEAKKLTSNKKTIMVHSSSCAGPPMGRRVFSLFGQPLTSFQYSASSRG